VLKSGFINPTLKTTIILSRQKYDNIVFGTIVLNKRTPSV